MAQSGGGAHGHMDVSDQRSTFHGFLTTSLWSSIFIAQMLALLVLAFAIGDGWWPGFSALVAVGVAAGLFFRMSAIYWVLQVVMWVLLGIGGLIVPALAGIGG